METYALTFFCQWNGHMSARPLGQRESADKVNIENKNFELYLFVGMLLPEEILSSAL